MTLASDACMPPWAAAEWERFGGTSDRITASWPRRFAPIATRSPARPPPITSTSVYSIFTVAPSLRRGRRGSHPGRRIGFTGPRRMLDADLDVGSQRRQAEREEERGQRPFQGLQAAPARIGIGAG